LPKVVGAVPAYTIEQAVAVAQEHNPDILIARKKVVGAHGGFIEARSGFLPSLTSSGLYDKRQTQSETSLRQEDYNAILRLDQNLSATTCAREPRRRHSRFRANCNIGPIIRT